MMYRASWRWKRRGYPAGWSKVHLFTEPVTPYQPGQPSQVALCGVDVPHSTSYSELGMGETAQGIPCRKCLNFSRWTDKEMTQEIYCLSKGPIALDNGLAGHFATDLVAANTGPDYPGAIWHPSPNYWPGRNGYPVIAIVNHIMQSTIGSADNWFLSPASEVSAHFGVGRDGTVIQWVKLGNSAWANGIMNKPDTSIDWINQCFTRGINPNLRTVAIEHEGLSGENFTNAQFQSTLELHRFLINQFNIPIDRAHLVGHYQIDSVNRPNCPGSAFPWGRLLDELKGNTTSLPADPNAHYFVETGVWLNNDYGFLDYWNKNGGLLDFGYPIRPASYDPVKQRVTQWFEKARFEAWPENADPYKVQTGLVGSELVAKEGL